LKRRIRKGEGLDASLTVNAIKVLLIHIPRSYLLLVVIGCQPDRQCNQRGAVSGHKYCPTTGKQNDRNRKIELLHFEREQRLNYSNSFHFF
jgi:hypothetical protein